MKLKWVKNVAWKEEIINSQGFLVGKPELRKDVGLKT
jgi:hypothetical protein